jgi:hypothetical protein
MQYNQPIFYFLPSNIISNRDNGIRQDPLPQFLRHKAVRIIQAFRAEYNIRWRVDYFLNKKIETGAVILPVHDTIFIRAVVYMFSIFVISDHGQSVIHEPRGMPELVDKGCLLYNRVIEGGVAGLPDDIFKNGNNRGLVD